MKTTLKDVLKTINKWQKENDVIFFGEFVEFKKGEVKDNRICAYGDKKTLKIALQEFNKMFKEDKNSFINCDEMIDLTGFDRDLLIEGNERDDVLPENPPAKAKRGDIWQLGRHKIICGDSLEIDI